jgi:hypothetical protein
MACKPYVSLKSRLEHMTSRYNTSEASIEAAVVGPKKKEVQCSLPKLKILVLLLTLNYFINYDLIRHFG